MDNANSFDAWADNCHVCGGTDWSNKTAAGCNKCLAATPPAPVDTGGAGEARGEALLPAFDINKLWAHLDEVVELHTSAESGQVHRHLNKRVVEEFAAALDTCLLATPAAPEAAPLGGWQDAEEDAIAVVHEVLNDWLEENEATDFDTNDVGHLFGMLGTAGYSIVRNHAAQ